MEVRWIASASASSLYAASLVARGQQHVDRALGEAVEPAAQELIAFCAADGLNVAALWDQLVPLAAGIENNQQLAVTALQKCLGREAAQRAADGLARQIGQLESAFNRAKPDAVDELALRSEPLRQQWEARGPGLLKTLGAITDDQFVAPQAQVVMVHPVLGGGGQAFIALNTVAFEAVLANPHAQLPEVVRLAWLLAQLNLDLPIYQGSLMRDRLALIGRLALVPAILEAAHEVELASSEADMLPKAIDAWDLNPVDDAALVAWWQTYRTSSIGWPAALAALDRMLA